MYGCAPALLSFVRQLQRRRVFRLIDAELATAGQSEARDGSPALLFDGRTHHFHGFHLGDEGVNVIAHEIELVRVVLVRWVNGDFRGRQGEDEPTVSGVGCGILEDVTEESAIGLGVGAVDDDVSSVDHENPFEAKRLLALLRQFLTARSIVEVAIRPLNQLTERVYSPKWPIEIWYGEDLTEQC
jgi:hypothetical protein